MGTNSDILDIIQNVHISRRIAESKHALSRFVPFSLRTSARQWALSKLDSFSSQLSTAGATALRLLFGGREIDESGFRDGILVDEGVVSKGITVELVEMTAQLDVTE